MDLARLRTWALVVAGMMAAVWLVTALASRAPGLALLEVDVRALDLTSYGGPRLAPAPLSLQVVQDARRDLLPLTPGAPASPRPSPTPWAVPSASPSAAPSASASPTPAPAPRPTPIPMPSPTILPTPTPLPSIVPTPTPSPSLLPNPLPSILPTPLATILPKL